MEFGKFALKVALVMLIINQIGPVRDIVNRNFLSGG